MNGKSSKHRDGWTGEKCPAADCHGGEVEGEYGPRSCQRCGGTGGEYIAALDERPEQ